MSFTASFPDHVRGEFAISDLAPDKAAVTPSLVDMDAEQRRQFDAVLAAARVLVMQRTAGSGTDSYEVTLEQGADYATATARVHP